MCVGLPMVVVHTRADGHAVVERQGERVLVNTLLLGLLEVGTAVLVHKDVAVRVVDSDELPLLEDALRALEAAQQGESLEGYFRDLEGREPVLPPHLRKGVAP